VRVRPAVLTLALAASLASGCSDSGSKSDGEENSSPAGAGKTGADTREAIASVRSFKDPKVKVDLVGLNRFGGQHVVVQLRYTNTGSDPYGTEYMVQDIAVPNDATEGGDQASGIGLLDTAARRVLLPYKQGDACLCSSGNSSAGRDVLEAGEHATFFAVVPAPAQGAKTATVVTPDTPPIPNVPISDEAPSAPPGQSIPTPGPGAQAVSHAMVATTEALDDTDETFDDGQNVKVNLRADVLFALNKADLSPKAHAVLKDIAQQIDASSDTTVEVDGHTDNTGNDAINQPLSQRRAETVKKALEGMVTRSGVTFQARGHGAQQPLYSNDSEEGRRRNRRVTVTFSRPQPAQQTPSSAPSSGQAGPVKLTIEGTPMAAQVTGVKQLGNGFGLLTYRLTNEGSSESPMSSLNYGSDWKNQVQFFANNVGLVDPAGKRKYWPVIYPTDYPGNNEYATLATPTAGAWDARVKPQQSRDFWAVVPLPPAASTFSVEIAKFPRIGGLSAS